ncbi:LysR substrate-binding domain-containing protein [Neisseria subflava]|uniref:LysR substrate-binding domain-containing protein n=1 Tax=Neisseria subflava TaxID=28449 RepID=UPI001F2DEBB0|nr:LysR substrate-binding domain-containing protein [Neisseria subflava]
MTPTPTARGAGRSTQKCTFFQKTSVSSQTTLPTNSPLRWQAALAGCVAAYIPEHLCRTHLQNGKLVELFPEIPRRPWQLYIYCPQRTVTSGRVLKVFDWLTEVLREMYDKEAT